MLPDVLLLSRRCAEGKEHVCDLGRHGAPGAGPRGRNNHRRECWHIWVPHYEDARSLGYWVSGIE